MDNHCNENREIEEILNLVGKYLDVPPGIPIRDPNKKYYIGAIHHEIALNLGISASVYISNKSIKHIVDRRPERAIDLILSIPDILLGPTKVSDNSAKRKGSYLFAKIDGKARGLVLEITKMPDENRVISAFFISRRTYERMKDVSGRPDVPPLAEGYGRSLLPHLPESEFPASEYK